MKIIVLALISMTLAGSAAAAPMGKVYGSVAKANAAALKEVSRTFLLGKGNGKFFKGNCTRQTARMFKCNWKIHMTGEFGYDATGTVRVTFNPYGVDATLAPGWQCYSAADMCPKP